MRTALHCIVLFCVIAAAAAVLAVVDRKQRKKRADQPAFDAEVMLDAIAAVESGQNWHAVGKGGELGRCQIREGTWYSLSNAPFAQWAPVDCDLTRRVERAHLDRLCATLRSLELDLEPENVAAAWRFGAGYARQGARTDAARRAGNLYREAMGL